MKTYFQFINEENENRITVQDIYSTLKQIFVEDDVLSTDSVYEPFEGGLRLVISISKLYTKDEVVIFTKFLFNVDNNKLIFQLMKDQVPFVAYPQILLHRLLHKAHEQYSMKNEIVLLFFQLMN